MTDIKLIVTDMDGTFLNSKYEVSPEFPEIYEELKKRNILFVPASGRQYFSITKYFEPILSDIAVIAENGAYVKYKNEEIFVDNLKREYINKIVECIRKIPNSRTVVSAKSGAYFETVDENFKEFLDQYYVLNSKIDDLTHPLDDQVLKIAINNLEGTEKNVYPFLKDFKKYGLEIVVSGAHWVDVMNKNVNKGKALSELQHSLNITPDQTMVFGDYMNDIEMLKKSKYSFAMKNAHPAVKEVANHEALSNNEFGVLDAIKKYVLV